MSMNGAYHYRLLPLVDQLVITVDVSFVSGQVFACIAGTEAPRQTTTDLPTNVCQASGLLKSY